MSLVSVIIPVYRPNLVYLKSAVKSILIQTHRDLEIIIIEDSPEGHVERMINRFNDDRIIYIGNNKRLGIAGSLNKGILISSGKYIARMDDDDFSLKTRIKIQHDFMEKNYNVDVCGTWCVKSNDYELMVHEDISPEKRRVKFLFENEGLFHPTAFFRKSFLIENSIMYDEELLMAEDYDLWERISQKSDLYTIHKPLVIYRIHNNQVSNDYKQLLYIKKIRKRQLRVFSQLNDKDIDEFLEFKCPSNYLKRIIKKIVLENRVKGYYSRLYLEGAIGCKWINECKCNKDLGFLMIVKEGILFNPVNKKYILLYIIISIIDKIRTTIQVKRSVLSKNYIIIKKIIEKCM